MVNPYYVQPGNDYSPGLRGLSDVVGQIKERTAEEDAIQARTDQMTAAREEISMAWESKDPAKIRATMVKYPEAAKGMKAAMETKFPGESGDKLKNAYFKAAVDFNQAPLVLQEMKAQFEMDGLDQSEIDQLDKFQTLIDTDPEKAKKEIESSLAILTMDDKEVWDRYQDITGTKEPGKPTATIQEYNLAKEQGYNKSFVEYKKDFGKQSTTSGKTYSKKNPDGSTRTIKNVKPGSEQESQLTESGFVEGSQTVGATKSAAERQTDRINEATDKLTTMANEDPNKFYKDHSFRQNADGSLYIDPVTGGPKELETFYKATGKRGNIKSIIGLGEQRDDAIELTELLELPSVQANLKKAEGSGFWDQAKSKWTNAINKWMQDQGIKGDSPTATAIARIQRMASEERKLYMGTAVTDNEMRSALAWMPNAGDSFDSVMNKTRLMGDEADQAFIRYVDVFEQAGADMSPFMSAFGIGRFGAEQEEQLSSEKTDEDLIKSLGL